MNARLDPNFSNFSLEKIAAMNFNTLQQRPKLGRWDVLVMGWRALWM
ncbi:hypothetical protein [Polaromonas sp.]|nr:hypothetical protein [Polaromonas sp.]